MTTLPVETVIAVLTARRDGASINAAAKVSGINYRTAQRIVEAAAVLAEAVLRGAAGVDILATSREPLRAEGESVYRLPPLEIPPASSELSARDVLSYPAVQLFVERATSNTDRFELRDADTSIAVEI